jgi:hypothetical protein
MYENIVDETAFVLRFGQPELTEAFLIQFPSELLVNIRNGIRVSTGMVLLGLGPYTKTGHIQGILSWISVPGIDLISIVRSAIIQHYEL